MVRGFWVGVLVLCSCATTGAGDLKRELLRFEPTTDKPTGWKRVQAPGYVLLTDLQPPQAERAAQLLSQSLGGLQAMFLRAPVKVDRKLIIIAMNDGLDFERRFGKRLWGFAMSGNDVTTLFLYGPPDRWFVRREINYEGTQSVLQHELSHAVLARYFPRQPRWFAEGLAEYLETFRWLDAETLQLGDPNLDAYREYRAIRSLTVRDMLEWSVVTEQERRGSDLKTGGLYGLSWAFIHYARNKMPQDFGRYLALLATTRDEAQAWRETFGPHADALDTAIYGYMKQGQYQQFTLKLPLEAPTVVRLETGDEVDVEAKTRLDRATEELK
jgi:hypothetical protein